MTNKRYRGRALWVPAHGTASLGLAPGAKLRSGSSQERVADQEARARGRPSKMNGLNESITAFPSFAALNNEILY